MKTINYNGQRVYTHSTNRVNAKDLERAVANEEVITDAYFFRIGPDRITEKVEFDRKAIERMQSGLMIDVKGDCSVASCAISGLVRVTQFLYDTGVFGRDLSALKGRKITAYNRGCFELLGIGVNVD